MDMKKLSIFIVISIISLLGFAHEFWLQPNKFFYSIREIAKIRFVVGENFNGENWAGNHEKIQQLLHFTPKDEIFDISKGISLNKGDSLLLPLKEEGTHMVVFNSSNSFINLEADKFNHYLLEDGLDEVYAYRKAHNETSKNGKEFYQRSVKTILQVGDEVSNACKLSTSLPLDIIPIENPYVTPILGASEKPLKVQFKIQFNNKPLIHALVKVWYRVPGIGLRMDTVRTNKKGWIVTERHPGPFLVSCVHMERMQDNTEADWQSYWASLSFEYSQFYNRPNIKKEKQ